MNYSIKTLFIVLISVWCSHLSQAQFTAIPDTTFESYLIAVGIDSDSTINGQVLTSDIDSIISLPIINRNISSLKGIEDFARLQSLNITGNPIDSLNISNLQDFWSLVASGVDLQYLNLDNTPALTLINVDSTLLDSIDVSNRPRLIEIRAEHCPNLVDIKLDNCTRLEDLFVRNSNLTTLDISTCSNLDLVRAENNAIHTTNLNNTNVSEIYLNNNQLTQIDLSQCSNLERVFCRYNQLTKVDVSQCPLLNTYSVGYNQVDSIDISNNPVIRKIYASHNGLEYIAIHNSPNLDYLDCSHNQLSELYFQNNNNLYTLNCDSNQILGLDFREALSLQNIYARHNRLAHVNLKNRSIFSTNFFFDQNPSYLVICVDNPSQSFAITKDPAATFSSICSNTSLLGHIKEDANFDCVPDSTEIGIPNYKLLLIENATNTSYFTNSNLDGLYTSELDNGNYTLFIQNNLPYRSPCLTTQTVVVGGSQLDTVNWSVQTTDTCDYLEVSISAPFIRATGGGSSYFINYCNLGTKEATDVYVEVTIDTLLQVLGTSIPIQQQNGNVYTFDLDTLHVGECGVFSIGVLADSTSPLDQVFCSKAHIFPDSLCSNFWQGPIIQTSASCVTDSVIFSLKNEGGAMSSPLQYSIFEDQVMLYTGPFTLGSDDSTQITYPTTIGKTYRIEATQASGIPSAVASPLAHSTIRDCEVDSTGIVFDASAIAFFNENTTPFIHIDCQPLRAAYDPNDKAGQPLGYGAAHFIPKGIPINYKVRFQNTGNDTAFNIVIIDTLSPHVDPASLQMQTSSHPYTWRLSGTGVLTVTFADIKLVDSITNEPLSHGFFTYTIDQNANLPIGTVIYNQAAIYFDYNVPIFTNTTFHTIGENYYKTTIPIKKTADESIQIDVFPNPFEQQTTLTVTGKVFETLQLEITDVTGRLIRTLEVEQTNIIRLQRGDLLAGVYFYQLKNGSKTIGTGKIIAQ